MMAILPQSIELELPERRYYLLVNGIRAEARGNVDEWPVLAEDWIENRTPHKAGRYGYHVNFWDRWIWQRKHVKNVCTILSRKRAAAPDARLFVVGHSNGAAIACAALAKDQTLRISELHLIAGAVDASFEKNGLNAAIERGQVKRVVCYCSGGDGALKLAKESGRFLRKVGLGYGYLGLVGPRDVRAPEGVVREVWKNEYDHSSWFDGGARFDDTMARVTGGGTDCLVGGDAITAGGGV